MVLNQQRRVELKRKRDMLQRHTVEQSVFEDKVWLPSEEFTDDTVMPLGKQYVKTTSYNAVRAKAKEFNNILFETAN